MIKFRQKSRWTPAPEGLHNAVVVDVVGDKTDNRNGEPSYDSVRVVWEIEALQTNGRRFTVTKIYQNADAFLHDFERVLDDDHPLMRREIEDIETIIGTPSRVDLVHNLKKNGDTFAHVQNQLQAGRVILQPSEHYSRLKYRCSSVQPLTQPASAAQFPESEVIRAAA